ncbi:hypothetical protein D3C86_1293640 [compost metagenome]
MLLGVEGAGHLVLQQTSEAGDALERGAQLVGQHAQELVLEGGEVLELFDPLALEAFGGHPLGGFAGEAQDAERRPVRVSDGHVAQVPVGRHRPVPQPDGQGLGVERRVRFEHPLQERHHRPGAFAEDRFDPTPEDPFGGQAEQA